MSIETMSLLKAIYFVRPTSRNIQHIERQLASPRLGEYHLFFSNILNNTQVHILDDSDKHEAVHQVQVTRTISLRILLQTTCICFRQLSIIQICSTFVIE